jgi:hypothetical protein
VLVVPLLKLCDVCLLVSTLSDDHKQHYHRECRKERLQNIAIGRSQFWEHSSRALELGDEEQLDANINRHTPKTLRAAKFTSTS